MSNDGDSNSKPHVARSSGNSQWLTPKEYTDQARQVMGRIDLDPASSAFANERIGAGTYYSLENDGLQHTWHGRVWMNPPYSRGVIDKFAQKLIESIEAGTVTEAVVLVNNATDTSWFDTLATKAAGFVFHRGRIKFEMEDGVKNTPLQGQVFIYYGPRVDRFFRVFGRYGLSLS